MAYYITSGTAQVGSGLALLKPDMTTVFTPTSSRRKAVWGPKRTAIAAAIMAVAVPLGASAAPNADHNVHFVPPSHHFVKAPKAQDGVPSSRVDNSKLDSFLQKRKTSNKNSKETVDVIVTLNPGQDLPLLYRPFVRRYFAVINGYEIDRLPVTLLSVLEKEVSVHRAHYNHPAKSLDVLSNTAVQADILAKQYGYSGAGVGVAFVDSGFTRVSHPDVSNSRVKFVDFTSSSTAARGPERPRHARGRHRRRHGPSRLEGNGHRARRLASSRSRCSTRTARARSATSSRRSTGWRRTTSPTTSASSTCRSAPACMSPTGPTRSRSPPRRSSTRASSSWPRPATSARTPTASCSGAASPSPGDAPWVITVCAFSTKGTLSTVDDTIASFSSSGPTVHRLHREA